MGMKTIFARRSRRFRLPMRVIAPLLAALMLVGPLRIISTPSSADQVSAQGIEVCSLEPLGGRIVQSCDLRNAGFRELEQQTINDLLAAHQLPASDYDRLMSWEPDAIRAAMFASLVTFITKEPAQRTATEQAMVDKMTELVRARRIAAAQFSIAQYTAWSVNPCGYEPPPGFTWTPPSSCFSPIGGIFDPPSPPTLEEFVAYGNAHIYADFMDDGQAAAAAAEAARLLGLVAGLVGAGVAAGIAAVIGSTLTVTSVLIAAIHPFLAASVAGANSAAAIASVAGASAGGVGAASLGALIGIVVAALVIAIIAIINVVTEAAIPDKLQANLTVAQAAVDLSQLVTTDAGKTEIFTTFLLETLPDFPGWVPGQQASDPSFDVTDAQGVTFHSQGLRHFCWNPVDCEGVSVFQTTRLSGGWFVAGSVLGGAERMALGIDYIDWEGKAWTAWRVGPQSFLHTRTGDSSEPFVSDEIRFTAWPGAFPEAPEGSLFIATINTPPSAPGLPVANPATNNGVFSLNWGAATDDEGEAVAYTLERCVARRELDLSGTGPTFKCMSPFTIVASGLTTTQYEFTSGAPEESGYWLYRVSATDGHATTPSATGSDVLVDKQPPSIKFLFPPPQPNAAGWYNSDVTASGTCDDGGVSFPPTNSGVVESSVIQTVVSEGADQSITLTCEDNAGNQGTRTFTGINIDKTPPVASHTGSYTVAEGATISLDGTGSSDALSGVASISWSTDQDDTFDDGNPADFTPADGPAVYDVKLRVVDLAGNETIVTTTVSSTNVAPTVEMPTAAPNPSEEGEAVTASAGFSDAGAADTYTCEIDWGDNITTLGTISNMVCTGSHTYADDPSGTLSDEYTITFTVTDDDDASAQSSVVHTVENVAPAIVNPVVVPEPSDEGEEVIASAGITDVGVKDTHTCEIDWGDDTTTPGTVSNMTCSGSHTYADDPSGTSLDEYTVRFTVTDDDGGSAQSSVVHTVNNVAPSIDQINAPAVVNYASWVSISVDASDPGGAHDPLTYAFDCDGDSTYEHATGPSRSVLCLPDQTTLSPTIGVRVTDDDQGVTTGTIELNVERRFCASVYTSRLRDSAECLSSEMNVTLRSGQTTLFCANIYTSILSYGRTNCGANALPLSVPASWPVTICENWSTGVLTYRYSGCTSTERERLIPSS